MKKINLFRFFCHSLLLAILSITLFSACKKRDYVPPKSSYGINAHLEKEWKMKKLFIWVSGIGTEITNQVDDYEETFHKDGTFELKNNGITINGTWEWEDNYSKIKRYDLTGNELDTYEILKFTSNELWYKYDDDGLEYMESQMEVKQ